MSGFGQHISLITTGAVWKYLNTGVDPGVTWQSTGFNDHAWSSGRAELGYGDGGEATVVGYGANPSARFITTYFRHQWVMTVTNASPFTNLTVRLLRDDGAVVYLNGMEVVRQNLPAGIIGATTLATVSVGGADETTYFAASIPPNLLVAGTNVVAVEVHQSSLASSDLSFDLELVGQVGTVITNPPSNPTNGPANTNLVMGCLRREVYTNVPGMWVADLQSSAKYPDHPDLVDLVASFEAPANFVDNYGQRLSGFVIPPVNGAYVFFISSDDQGVLFLSTDESPSNKVQIAREDTWSPQRTWVNFPTRTNNANISAPIMLETGRKYYVEAVMKEGGGGDSLAVTWQMPGGNLPANGDPPIAGEFLATYGPPFPSTNLPPTITLVSPATGTVFAPPANIQISAIAGDPNGSVQTLEFFAGNTCLFSLTNPPLGETVWYAWTNVSEGNYALTAKATDSTGLATTSAPVYINVQGEVPPDPTGESELHVVGIYEGVRNAFGIQQAAVVVNRPGKRVTLFLSAYEPVTWNVTVMAGTIVEKVILSGYNRQTVQGLPAGVPVVSRAYEDGNFDYLYIGYTVDSSRFLQTVPKLRVLTGLEISSFQGNYQAPYPTPFAITNVQQDPRLLSNYPQPTPLSELTNLTFQLSFYAPGTVGGSVVARSYTLAGAQDGGSLLPSNLRVVGDGSQRFFYGISGHGVLKVDAQIGSAQTMNLGPNVPELSWPMGIAYDTNYHQVLLVSLGGEGYLYSYAPTLEQWSVVSSMNNLDLACLEYHQSEDALYGISVNWGETGRAALYRFTPDGMYLGEMPLPILPLGIGPTGYRSELVSVGDYLVWLLMPDSYYANQADARIYLIDPRSDQIWLAYRQTATAANQSPVVQITSPTNHTTFVAGDSVPLVAAASDADGVVRSVEFLANGRTIGIVAASPYRYLWTNLAQGEYTLTARAVDDKGAITVSAPVRIMVQQPAALATRQLPATYTPGVGFTVTLAVTPNLAVNSYAVEDQPPAGWTVTNINEGGAFDPLHGKVKFGPFLDNLARSLTYQVIPPPAAIGSQRFTGHASADGASEMISGNQVIEPASVPPTVVLASPVAGTVLVAPARINFTAAVTPGSSPMLWTEFYANDQLVGRDADQPYEFTWDQVPAGIYVLKAKATDAGRNYAVSLPVTVTVAAPTNVPPLVSIIQPTTGTGFTAPTNIDIVADAYDPDGAVAQVEFFADANRLGLGTPVFNAFPDTNTVRLIFTWTNAVPGAYELTARAADSQGAITVSAPVSIQVGTAHHLPIVSVTAVDRLAIESTNSYLNYGYFAITRQDGDLSLPMTVSYSLEGSASNGVDYLVLPSSVEIPAGETVAMIKIDPISDGLAESHETVVLTLLSQAQYEIGASNSATVYIIDPIPFPPLPPGMIVPAGGDLSLASLNTFALAPRLYHVATRTGGRQMLLIGQPGQVVTFEASENLTDWKSLGTLKIDPDGVLEFADPTAFQFNRSFYRIVSGPASNVLSPQ